MLKEFRQNASDLILKKGFQLATFIYMGANGLLLAENGFYPDDADPYRNIAAPLIYLAANGFGLASNPGKKSREVAQKHARTANTLGFFGTLATIVSFAGAGQEGFQLLPVVVASLAATGQCIASHIPRALKQFTGNKTQIEKKEIEKPKEKILKSKWDSDFVKGGAIQAGVGALVTAGVFIANITGMMRFSAIGWNIGDVFKYQWAVKNAEKTIQEQKLQAA